MNQDNITIACSFNDKYVQHAFIMIKSLIKSSSRQVEFHCLVSDISNRNRSKLEKLQDENVRIVFHYISISRFDGFHLGKLSVEAYFRFLIPEILSSKKRVLYLDVDLIVVGDIAELFYLNLGAQRLGAVADPGVDGLFVKRLKGQEGEYFNSGVMLLDVQKFSSEEVDSWLRFAKENQERIIFHDQCVLNFFNDFKLIPPKFNLLSQFFLPPALRNNTAYREEEVVDAKKNAVVVHYNATFGKPWSGKCRHPSRNLYLGFLLRSPWRFQAVSLFLSQSFTKGWDLIRRRKPHGR